MADYTKYLRLMKPQGNEYYNVENFNHNAELIDKETEKLNNAVTEIKNGATREKPGIVQFGTEEGKALEGMMLARLAGCVGYGGDIQTAGVKDVNYIYYDRNTRKMYKCLNQNSDVSANVANFIPLDNNSLLDRLENLITIQSYNNWNIGNGITSSSAKVYKIGELKIMYISFTTAKVLNNFTFKFPITFKENPYVSYTDNSSGANIGELFGIDWATTSSVLLSNIQSATMLVVGI
ncbi:hypothetical protein [Fusobacterium polymorphum]|uniref:hypothetical protein n=2 Tax=Fusobacterium nucleatum subsp. polymorphum TaxID=76857 RepID=UPI003009C959